MDLTTQEYEELTTHDTLAMYEIQKLFKVGYLKTRGRIAGTCQDRVPGLRDIYGFSSGSKRQTSIRKVNSQFLLLKSIRSRAWPIKNKLLYLLATRLI